MRDKFDNTPAARAYASPPCYAAQVATDYFDPLAVDPEQARDVARWRKAERMRLRGDRIALSVAERKSAGAALAAHLRTYLRERFGDMHGQVFSAYWPIKGEPDLRPLMDELHKAGVVIALPLVEVKQAPLVFRRWTPGTKMVKGDWGIPVPPPDAPEVIPSITLAPVVGWTGDGYRLGYGGGYFDRTLAALTPRPFTIGIGYAAARLDTIFPQPHDIAMDLVLTEAGTKYERP
ncbi:5-formyltetrahydrofolate cyclo-ligase [Zhengella sp. ZM62]|uniref:5-formyltetrahydrofolate cyclo-ligase n=1 Tax=Zhengella sedimenti TaxID=3390035 RepID=UPI0039763723